MAILSFDFGLVWGVVACDFGRPGLPGNSQTTRVVPIQRLQ